MALDIPLLESTITVVEAHLQFMRAKLKPQTKASLIALLYSHWSVHRYMSADQLADFLKQNTPRAK